jgi:hypothetical protein
MDTNELRSLQEAYLEVVENQQLDEVSLKTKMSAFKKRATDEFESDGENPKNYTKSGKSKADQTQANIVKKHGKKAGEHAERTAHAGIFGRKSFSMPKKPTNEEVSVYDIILSHLLDEGYAETPEAAKSIMVNMSEEWRDEIIEEAKADAELTPLQKIRKRNKAYAMPGEKAGEQTGNRRSERASARGKKKERGAKSAFGTMRHVGGPYKGDNYSRYMGK